MLRRVALSALAVALVTASALTAHGVRFSASAAASAVNCEITGTANLSPGVTVTPKATSYTFTGTLKSCAGTDKTAKTGSVSAAGAGKLSCAEGTSKGTSTVTWSNGQSSTISFSTTDAASGVLVNGSVTGGEFAGDKVGGVLNFVTTQAKLCTSTGLTTLSFTGDIGTA